MTTIEAARHVVENGCSLMRPRKDTPHQWDVKEAFGGKKRGWFYMDAFTASMLVGVYNALNGTPTMSAEAMREKFNRLPLMALINLGWKHTKAAA